MLNFNILAAPSIPFIHRNYHTLLSSVKNFWLSRFWLTLTLCGCAHVMWMTMDEAYLSFLLEFFHYFG